MQMSFQQSEQIAARRRWILVLVDSTDGVTGKTGQTGTVQVSANGGTPAASTNSIVEVDSVNMPGHYYIELTQAELGTLGMISIYYKAATTLAFHDRGFVSYDDPFARHGGFAFEGSGSGKGGVTKTQADDLLKKIQEMIREEFAKEEKVEAEPAVDYGPKLDQIIEAVTAEDPEAEPIDFSPVLDAISNIPQPKDYTASLSGIVKQVQGLGKITKLDVDGFAKAVSGFQAKMSTASKEINGSLDEVTAIKKGFAVLQKTMDEFNKTLAEQSDMDKRFEAMVSGAQNAKLEALVKQITTLGVSLTNFKYDLNLKSLNK